MSECQGPVDSACLDADPAVTVDVSSEPDDTPSEMDDSISVSYAYLDLLIQRANSSHCRTCSCR